MSRSLAVGLVVGTLLVCTVSASAQDAPAVSDASATTTPAAAPAPLAVAPPVAPPPDPCHIPPEAAAFTNRVLSRIGAMKQDSYDFIGWEQPGLPTKEAIGLYKTPTTIDPERVVARVLDVNHYHGNLDHVAKSYSIADSRYTMPAAVRFYEVVDLSAIGDIQFDAVLKDAGTCKGFRVVTWHLNTTATQALNRDNGMRSAYNDGVWLASPTVIGYALSSAPVEDDTNYLQWKALTVGADATAEGVFQNNLEGMYKWTLKP